MTVTFDRNKILFAHFTENELTKINYCFGELTFLVILFSKLFFLKFFLAFLMWNRYSDSTIETLEVLDSDDKIDLELILALICHIVRSEGVSSIFSLPPLLPGM